ncbi:CoA-binding protein [Pelotomaculum terephthalicicum JT]|uniref:CoA-binding protein n=1 Tax=Pelotomaculum TaxID=191373 RepID=UPI0009CD7F84|nr:MULTISPECIES: CoA-binding protein [Pelotomaculum]MCG9968861.1 CoA-binding protein [Pelotomaculum terephthalicicum JT]OPX85078.1 MAG: hypothetical protein A4E54_02628 [Pelotomaculum sp. PtaB.Bin117]
MPFNSIEKEIKELLKNSRCIAVVGLSDKPERDSYKVAKYLQEHGYRIIPVNPSLKNDVLGEKPYPSLKDVPGNVEIVNIFRRSEDVPAIVQEALLLKPKAIWMQLGVSNIDAAEQANKENVLVVMNRCIKIAHGLLLGKNQQQ